MQAQSSLLMQAQYSPLLMQSPVFAVDASPILTVGARHTYMTRYSVSFVFEKQRKFWKRNLQLSHMLYGKLAYCEQT
ncbi:hypothetical protein CEXT_753981 [Caerostris extrusa]|uniref:Uncharacterized protein n=1 Tax=Caerostris extrusa TaxID=172846 RepID=A0AAV4Q2Q0_CAEEX|nr:hypothetical protein CEXT_753981 [Caerostris extrusa]